MMDGTHFPLKVERTSAQTQIQDQRVLHPLRLGTVYPLRDASQRITLHFIYPKNDLDLLFLPDASKRVCRLLLVTDPGDTWSRVRFEQEESIPSCVTVSTQIDNTNIG